MFCNKTIIVFVFVASYPHSQSRGRTHAFPQEIQDKQSSAEPASLQHLLQCPDKHDRSVKVAWPAGPSPARPSHTAARHSQAAQGPSGHRSPAAALFPRAQ